MKKFLLTLFTLFFVVSVSASEYSGLPYKNIKDNTKISVSEDGASWKTNVNKNKDIYYIKKGQEFYLNDDSLAFSTGSYYTFLLNNNLIGYSNSDFKFYEYSLNNGLPDKKELSIEEVQALFKDYKVINISEFNTNTNSIKIKKGIGTLKLIILNDTDRDFSNYSFTSGNAKFVSYPGTGILKIKKAGMIQLSRFGENSKNYPWFVILVR